MSGSYLAHVHPVINRADGGRDLMSLSSPLKLEVHTKTAYVVLSQGRKHHTWTIC
jgi:hypothetical protein